MKITRMFSIRLIFCLALLFTSGFSSIVAQNATDSLIIENAVNKSTLPITSKKTNHNPIRTPIIIVSIILGLVVIFLFQYPGKS